MLTNANTEEAAEQMELAPVPVPASNPLAPPPAPSGSEALENPQHERFAATVTGWGGRGEPTRGYEAYREVYGTANDATARVNASRLLARPDVRARCAWMRSQLAAAALIDAGAVRADLFRKRMQIIDKTINTRHRDVAVAVMRDVEKSLGIDRPAVEQETTETATAGVEAVERVGQAIEALAAEFSAQRVTRTVIRA